MGSSETTISPAARDVQSERPTTEISLSRVGVTGIEKVLRVKSNGTEELYHAEL